eukprot:CAMPEP_0172655970 /NCGR_PEP_ID=MMETSP1074-20121228/1031_1 /TAXON_ID=2916 /ORGANISM="Ceratium fusus, Strain PA161109" /LENGTH=76 /DNA_ID=CAMNT_0013470719 /DNA_START=120 /DNA_END=350 /DNA_ORIENTATION=-
MRDMAVKTFEYPARSATGFMLSACMRMSAKSAGFPINAARPPALNAHTAFSPKLSDFPGFFIAPVNWSKSPKRAPV